MIQGQKWILPLRVVSWDEQKNRINIKKQGLDFCDAMTDDMIDTSDIPQLTDEFFETAKWRMPEQKVKITVEVEPEVVNWFKAQGENYKYCLTAALRIYAQAHQMVKKEKAG